MLLFIRLAVEEGSVCKIYIKSVIQLLLFLFCPQAQLPESLPAFSISTENKGKKGGRGKDRDNNACVCVCAHERVFGDKLYQQNKINVYT